MSDTGNTPTAVISDDWATAFLNEFARRRPQLGLSLTHDLQAVRQSAGAAPLLVSAEAERAMALVQQWRDTPCTCYPGGVNPADYEGPQVWCDQHGSPSAAWAVAEGLRAELADSQFKFEQMRRERDTADAIAANWKTRVTEVSAALAASKRRNGVLEALGAGAEQTYTAWEEAVTELAALRAAEHSVGGQEKPSDEALWSAIHRVLWGAALPGDRAAIDELTGNLVAAVRSAAPVGGQHTSATGSAGSSGAGTPSAEAEPSDAQVEAAAKASHDWANKDTGETATAWEMLHPRSREYELKRARVIVRAAAAVSGERHSSVVVTPSAEATPPSEEQR